jgi:hypothetical protein
MWRAWPILVLLVSVAGCGPGRYDELAREQTELNEELAREWAGISDSATMKSAAPKLGDKYRKLIRLNRVAKALAKPSAELNELLREKYGRRMEAAVNQILRDQQRVKDLPGGPEFLREVKEGFRSPKGG